MYFRFVNKRIGSQIIMIVIALIAIMMIFVFGYMLLSNLSSIHLLHRIVALLFVLGSLRLLWYLLPNICLLYFLQGVDVTEGDGVKLNWKNGKTTCYAFDTAVCGYVTTDEESSLTLRGKWLTKKIISTRCFEQGDELRALLEKEPIISSYQLKH